MWEYLLLIPIGLLAGVLGGLLGVGGSIVMIPAMVLLLSHPNQHRFQGAAMIVNFFLVLPAAFQHYRAGAVLKPIIRGTIPAAALGVIVGVWLSAGHWFSGANEVRLSRLFGAFLLVNAVYNVRRLLDKRRLPEMTEVDAEAIPLWKIAVVGFPVGLVGGLLGVGGGILAVPLQQMLLRIPLRRAIANSTMTIIVVGLIGAIYKNYTNLQEGIALASSLKIALFLIPTAMLGGYLGGPLTHKLPRRALRIVFTLLMCYAGYEMITR